MGDEESVDEFDWELESSRVKSAEKLPIPEIFRDQVVMGSNKKSTWWGYDTETGYAFLSSGYTNGDRFITINNRSYKLEKGSRVTIPKAEKEEVTEGVLGKDRPGKHSNVYFYSDSRMERSEIFSVIILSKNQLAEALHKEQIYSELFEAKQDVGGAPGPGPNSLAGEVRGSDKNKLDENFTEDFFKDTFPVPE